MRAVKASPELDTPWSQGRPTSHLASRGNGTPPPCPEIESRARGLHPPARSLLDQVVHLQLLSPSVINLFLEQTASHHGEYNSGESVGHALVHAGLLTGYQLDRILAGTTHGLVLGNYRVVDRLGAGAMSVVFLAEHVFMNRLAAVKVFPVDDDCPPPLLKRFYSEMRIQADLHHPNIATAYDSGRLPPSRPGMPVLLYLVMENVRGGDLEQYVLDHGPVPVAQACDWIRQAACGLQEAHDHHLIHRDVKPSNLLLTERRRLKVVDFGLARQFTSRLTDPRELLGTLEYMAPEQSHDASAVGAGADVYGLGATLFWLLTGQTPFAPASTVAQALTRLQTERPRRLRSIRPEIPQELDDLVDRLQDPDPTSRPATPLAVMNALLPFALPLDGPLCHLLSGAEAISSGEEGSPGEPSPGDVTSKASLLASAPHRALGAEPGPSRVLLVDDEPGVRELCRSVLDARGHHCQEARDAQEAFDLVQQADFDLVLLDLNLPGLHGYEVCRRLRERRGAGNLKVLIVAGSGDQNELAEALPLGADDYLAKPFELRQLDCKVEHVLRLKRAQDRADLLARELVLTNRQLENSLAARTNDVRLAQDALLFAMAKMAESRDGETAGHLRRLQRYTRCLADCAAEDSAWSRVIDATFLAQLHRCVPLHDIGKIGLPDSILLKPGQLDAAERELIQTHTVLGDRILDALAQEHGESLEFLGMARAIVRHHHERYDGHGYPDGLQADAIPPAARLVALADVYDALRRQRYHKHALAHADAVVILLERSTGQFDPALVWAFHKCELEFERIYRAIPM